MKEPMPHQNAKNKMPHQDDFRWNVFRKQDEITFTLNPKKTFISKLVNFFFATTRKIRTSITCRKIMFRFVLM